MAALLHADRTADEPSCSGPIERSIPVGIVMLPAARESSGRSVQWLQHTGRDVARHTFTCAQCRRHVDHRPWCSAGIAHGHARAVGARLHRLQSGWHTSAASIHPSLASGIESCWKLKLGVHLTAQHVDRSASEIDGYTATCVLRVPVKSRQCRAAVRVHERYTRVPSPKGPYPVRIVASSFFDPRQIGFSSGNRPYFSFFRRRPYETV